MRWYEYEMEVDDLHAPDALKAKLLAMQEQAPSQQTQPLAFPAPSAQKPARKKPIRFPAKRYFGLAACLALCVVVGGSAFSVVVGGSAFNVLHLGAGSAAPMTVNSSRAAAGGADDNALYAMASSPETAAYGADDSTNSALLTSGEVENRDAAQSDSAKILYTANLSLESKDYDAAVAALNTALSDADGYMESSNESTYNGSSRSLSLTLRVPQDSYQSFLTAAAQAGNLVSKSEQADDVTSQYIDLEARISNLTAQRTRLQELQASAETLSDLLDIESSLSDVQYQLESYQSQLDWYAQQVACCTVYVSLEEVKEYTPAEESFGERLAASFRNGWTNFVAGLQQLVVWVLLVWPLLLVLAVLAAGILLWRRRKTSRK